MLNNRPQEIYEKYNVELIVFGSLLEKPANFGNLVRTGEIFGITELIIDNKNLLQNREFKSVSMSGEKWLKIKEVKKTDSIAYL